MKKLTLLIVFGLASLLNGYGQKTERSWSPFLPTQAQNFSEVMDPSPEKNDLVVHSPNQTSEVAQYRAFKATQAKQISLRQSTSGNTIWLPVQLHIAQDLNQSTATSPFTVFQLMNMVNTNLEAANVQLYPCGPINYISDNSVYTLFRGNRSILDNYHNTGLMNIYFVNDYVGYCGEGDYPGTGEKIIYSARCFGFSGGSVLTHLVGQYFSLYPTHGISANPAEFADGRNCATAGDEICDTPADPNLFTSGYNSNTCQYTGTAVDGDQQPYNPDPTNFMSYASGDCRDHFSPQQLTRLYNGAAVDRAGLTNCSTQYSCANAINQFPYQEGFENGWNGWEHMEVDGYDLMISSGPTPTSGTGPSAAAEGNNYVFSEATNNLSGAGIESPCFDFTNVSQPTLSFKYHMYGSDITSLGIQVSLDGGFWWYANTNPLISRIDGNQGNNWLTHTVDLSDYANEPSFRFRIIAIRDNNKGDLQDIAIDDIQVSSSCFSLDVTTLDVSCHDSSDGLAIVIPDNPPSNMSINWSSGATNTNSIQGLEPGNYSVTVSDNNTCNVIENFSIYAPDSLYMELFTQGVSSIASNNGVIESVTHGGTPPYTYLWENGSTNSHRINLTSGIYGVTVTDAKNCTFSTEVFVGVQSACNGTKSNWPYHNPLEQRTGLFGQNTADDNRNWRNRSGSTPTTNTGPTSAAQGTNYRYFESSGNNGHPFKLAILTTKKCLNLANLSNPVFEFKYHMYGQTMGSLSIQVHNGTFWTNYIWQKEGDQGNSWHQASIDLSAFQNDIIRIRIIGQTGNGQQSDIAIDDIWIKSATSSTANFKENEPRQYQQKISFETTEESINLFPNPAKESVWLEFFEGEIAERKVTLIDAIGNRLRSYTSFDTTMELNVDDLLPGVYFLRVEKEGEKEPQIKRLIISN